MASALITAGRAADLAGCISSFLVELSRTGQPVLCSHPASLSRGVATAVACGLQEAVSFQPPRLIGPLAANLTKPTVPGELGVQPDWSGATIVALCCQEPLPVTLAYCPVPVTW